MMYYLVNWVHAHHLSLLELFAFDEISAESGRNFGHNRSGVSVHHMIFGFCHVTHEPQDGDPKSHRSL